MPRWLLLPTLILMVGPAGGQESVQGKKILLPSPAEEARALQLIEEVLREDFQAAKTPEARTRLAGLLVQQAKEAREDPGLRYTLLLQASSTAAQAGDIHLALQITDEILREFHAPEWPMKNRVFGMLAQADLKSDSAQGLVEILLPLMHEAVEADQFDAALSLGNWAATAARRAQNPDLLGSVQKRQAEIQAVQKGFAQMQGHIEKLRQDPKDPQANLELGKYYALLKGRWEKGLPLLALGADESLRALARKDLDQPEGPHEQLALADAWWDQGLQEKGFLQMTLQKRAAHWYGQAVGGLQGLLRTKGLKRIDQVSLRLANLSGEGPLGPVGEIKKLEGHTEEIKSVAFSADGRYGVTGGVDQTVRVWDLGTGKEEKTLRGHTKQIWSVAFHPNNRQVFSASWDASARLWDIKSGTEVKRFSHRLDCNSLAVARDGSRLLTGSDDHNVYLWDVATGGEIKRFLGHTGFVYAVALSPDGRYAASGGVDRTVRVFDVSTGTTIRVFEGHQKAVQRVAFSPDGRHIFSCGDDACRQWDMTTGKEFRRFPGSSGAVLALAVSPDGRRLLTGGEDRTIHVWDLTTGRELQKLTGHTDSVTALAVSPDNRRVLSGSQDRTVRLWGLPIR